MASNEDSHHYLIVDGKAVANRGLRRRLMTGRWMTDVEYQGVTNSCCANAVAGAYEYLCKRQAEKTGDTVGDISRLFIYYVGRLADAAMFNEEHLPLEDGGMTACAAANSGYVPKPDSSDPEASEHGTHALLLVGTWADGGYCYVAYDYVCNPDYNLMEYVGQWVPNQEHIVDRSKVREKEMHPVEGGQLLVNKSGICLILSPKLVRADGGRVFKAIDTDGSGFIEPGELKTAYRLVMLRAAGRKERLTTLQQGVYITDAQLKAVLMMYDTSGDGKIDFDEYCVMVGVKDKNGNIIGASA
ncbi:hypothetical protein GUITHDRAFT_131775 [Guillardia theta CCMP2712]|uniref:EF-hand domain-containing protein n=1 Tax=Guillardia theta (strain CCMP2712) TaxID=905079 RepID=L1K304_GUITC|nr:hypothetical protein GUITHDRAFT_131775 [Guillardia theta CCMP2712]EKX54748.1 hypothetical protein GUITHDRAFT_131775 [Guillardia theta CCMP2712]|eukprot:XP_005841728.1 hypothetical protein GUITHDRAFT_131775 [Guillardia theta CCMP2712]